MLTEIKGSDLPLEEASMDTTTWTFVITGALLCQASLFCLAIFILKVLKCTKSICIPVIRCKNCKWFGDAGCAIKIVDECDKPTENDFCSFAELKEETEVK